MHLRDLFRVYGSVVPRSLVWGILGATEGVLFKYLGQTSNHFEWIRHSDEGGVWHHPYTLHVLGMVLGFSLVMRIQIAYQRFWEGTSMCHLALAKWGDAAMQVFAFDEASKDAFEESGFEFRMLMLHYASLMTACALIDIRRDDDDLNAPMTVNYEDPYGFQPMEREMDGSFSTKTVEEAQQLSDTQLDHIIEATGMPGTSFSRGRKSSERGPPAVPLQMLLQVWKAHRLGPTPLHSRPRIPALAQPPSHGWPHPGVPAERSPSSRTDAARLARTDQAAEHQLIQLIRACRAGGPWQAANLVWPDGARPALPQLGQ